MKTRLPAFVLSAVCGLALPAAALAHAPAGPASADPAGAPQAEGVDKSPVAAALARADAAAKAIVEVPDGKRTFENTVGAIDDLLSRLNADTTFMQFWQYVSTDAAEREASRRAAEDVSNYLIDFGKREDLYRAVKAYAATNPELEGERARLLRFILRDYRRDGMELTPEKRAELTAVQKEITRLGIEFEKGIRDDASVLPCAEADLKGMPEDFVANLPRAGGMRLVGMAAPTYIPVMEGCEIEATRQKVWLLHKRRAGKNNVATLEKILELRARAASILGYASAADYEEEVLMSKGSAAVRKFYDDLRPLVRAKAEEDHKELLAAKRAHTGDAAAELQPWDFMFYKTLLLKDKYKVDPEQVKQYFPMVRVMDGLFSVTQRLYGLKYTDVTADASKRGRAVWHPDVKLYEVADAATGEVLGEFYLDLFPRDNKYTHFAQWGLLEHKTFMDGSRQRPLAALVCNFTKPTPEKPSLLQHHEVETFFHEFGHCLHTVLSEATLARFSGTSVERDFVEAPSQMFENWVWDPEVLATFARHYKTGEPMPKAMVEGMVAAKNLGSGMDAQQQMYYGLMDLSFHTVPGGKVDTIAVNDKVFAENTMYRPIPGTYLHGSFGHLVGYQAGYYGYLWSLVYASDMASRFKESGFLNTQTGMAYRKSVLARGGTVDGMDLVRGFLGREPDMKSFLDHLGLKKQSAARD